MWISFNSPQNRVDYEVKHFKLTFLYKLEKRSRLIHQPYMFIYFPNVESSVECKLKRVRRLEILG